MSRTATLALLSCLPLTACSTAPSVPGPAMTSTVTSTVTVTATQVATRTVQGPTVTMTPAPVTVSVTLEAPGPADVTDEYVTWRRAHHPDNDTDKQYQAVQQALLNAGQLDVLTVYRAPGWGWNCQGEPVELSGQAITTIRILNQDGSVFRLCRPGAA